MAARRRAKRGIFCNAVRQAWRTDCAPPRNNLRVAAGHGRPPCAANIRMLYAILVVNVRNNSATPCAKHFFFGFDFKIRDLCNSGSKCIEGSEPELGCSCWRQWRIRIPFPGGAVEPALEGLTNLARTETPRKADRNKSDHGKRRRTAAAGGGAQGGRRRRG
ncbi:hypothetical protein F511_07233 [Dorcoceras hygrometricum]|uniref:Uncharacterized protein n=1 Tax=Dorcoceras hygrometricum TaxID=472368 RepID=A0A2Z7AXD6_9LAMI|nr:hypothetical protein F511_07233 [Dorcoceras hygrometricum]